MASRRKGIVLRIVGGMFCIIGATFGVLRLVGYADRAFVATGASLVAIGASLIAIGTVFMAKEREPEQPEPK